MTRRFRFLFILLVAVWVRLGTPIHAFPQDCAEVCTSQTTCTETCYPDELAFINGNSITCLQWGTYETPCCGDFVCGSGENASSCFDDCHCGNGVCDGGENQSTCAQDCSGGQTGGNGPGCGDGTCDPARNEDCDTCVQDCHSGGDCGTCGDQVCDGNEIGGAGSGNESHCNPVTQTWCTYCYFDCGDCNIVTCDPGHGQGSGGQTCADMYGRCKDCSGDFDCGYSDEICNFGTGKCVVPQGCASGGTAFCQTQYGSDWFCNSSNVCQRTF